jgi:hypothetical protein
MEHPPYYPDLALNNFWLFPEIHVRSPLKGLRFQDTENIEKSDDGTTSYSITGVPKMFPTVAASAKYIAAAAQVEYFEGDPFQ